MIILKFLAIIVLLTLIGCSTLDDQSTVQPTQHFYQLGLEAYQKGLFKEAQSQWQKGFSLAKRNTEMSAHFLTGLARVAESTGNYKEAINLAEQVLPIASTLSNKILEARANAIIGQTYRQLGNYSEAQYYSELARETARQMGDLLIESDSSRNLGAIHQAQGRLDSAKDMYQQSLEFAYKANDQWLQAKALNNLGELLQRKAQFADALIHYQQSLQLRESINDLAGQGSVLGNICRAYQDLNDYKSALSYCENALKMARQTDDRAREANHLSNIAGIYFDLGKLNEAKKYHSQSITIKKDLEDYDGVARAYNNVAIIYELESNTGEALEYFLKSLDIKKQLDDKSGQSATYFNIGRIYFDSGKYDEALINLKHALTIQTELKEPRLLWRIYSKLSHVYRKLGSINFAIYLGKLAVNNIQSVRLSNQGLSKNLQTSYLKDKEIAYEQLTDLLIVQGRLAEAQQIQAMLKEEEFHDFIRRDPNADNRSTKAGYQPAEAEWQNEYQKIEQDLVKLSKEMHDLKKKGSAKTPEDEDRLIELDDKFSIATKKFQDTLDKLATASNQDIEERDFDNDLTGLVSDLGDDVVLLQMVTRDEGMWILLTTAETRKSYEIKINRITLNQHIYTLRTALVDSNQDPRPAGKILYELLFAPLKNDLKQANAKTLMLSLDGALRYIPLAALYDGEHYLIENFALSIFNDAIQQNMKDQPESSWKVAGLGTSQAYPNFSPLPGVPKELENIVQRDTTDNTGVLPGVIFLDQAFDQKQFRLALLDEYPVVHIASHFELKPGTEKDSFLLLGDGSHLNLADIRRGSFNFKGVDLLTLSACNTATADEGIGGKEVEGFAVLAQQKGAKGILASLWSVSDDSTSLLMQRMYQLHKEEKLSKAEALRKAQLALLQGTKSPQTVDGQHDPERGRGIGLDSKEHQPETYTHPFFWAPFILMGNWL